MAKVYILTLLVFIALFGFGNTGSRKAVKEVYLSQVGVREITGTNDGKEVEKYLRFSGLGKGNPWCAAFVGWCFHTAGVKAITSAWSPAWFPAEKIVYTRGLKTSYQPQSGDVFGIWFKRLGRIAHVGFVDSWQGDVVMTVEGNTNSEGSRDGDGVYKKRRLKSQIYQVSRWINE
jgi:hypothetical protein